MPLMKDNFKMSSFIKARSLDSTSPLLSPALTLSCCILRKIGIPKFNTKRNFQPWPSNLSTIMMLNTKERLVILLMVQLLSFSDYRIIYSFSKFNS